MADNINTDNSIKRYYCIYLINRSPDSKQKDFSRGSIKLIKLDTIPYDEYSIGWKRNLIHQDIYKAQELCGNAPGIPTSKSSGLYEIWDGTLTVVPGGIFISDAKNAVSENTFIKYCKASEIYDSSVYSGDYRFLLNMQNPNCLWSPSIITEQPYTSNSLIAYPDFDISSENITFKEYDSSKQNLILYNNYPGIVYLAEVLLYGDCNSEELPEPIEFCLQVEIERKHLYPLAKSKEDIYDKIITEDTNIEIVPDTKTYELNSNDEDTTFYLGKKEVYEYVKNIINIDKIMERNQLLTFNSFMEFCETREPQPLTYLLNIQGLTESLLEDDSEDRKIKKQFKDKFGAELTKRYYKYYSSPIYGHIKGYLPWNMDSPSDCVSPYMGISAERLSSALDELDQYMDNFKQKAKKDSKLIYNKDGWKIYKIESYNAAVYYGQQISPGVSWEFVKRKHVYYRDSNSKEIGPHAFYNFLEEVGDETTRGYYFIFAPDGEKWAYLDWGNKKAFNNNVLFINNDYSKVYFLNTSSTEISQTFPQGVLDCLPYFDSFVPYNEDECTIFLEEGTWVVYKSTTLRATLKKLKEKAAYLNTVVSSHSKANTYYILINNEESKESCWCYFDYKDKDISKKQKDILIGVTGELVDPDSNQHEHSYQTYAKDYHEYNYSTIHTATTYIPLSILNGLPYLATISTEANEDMEEIYSNGDWTIYKTTTSGVLSHLNKEKDCDLSRYIGTAAVDCYLITNGNEWWAYFDYGKKLPSLKSAFLHPNNSTYADSRNKFFKNNYLRSYEYNSFTQGAYHSGTNGVADLGFPIDVLNHLPNFDQTNIMQDITQRKKLAELNMENGTFYYTRFQGNMSKRNSLFALVLPYIEKLIVSNSALSLPTRGYASSFTSEDLGFLSLKEVEFEPGSRIQIIPSKLFSNSRSLVKVSIPQSVRVIGNEAFGWCSKLTDVRIEDGSSPLTLEGFSFQGTGLHSITLPARTITIFSSAFLDTPYLTEIRIKGKYRPSIFKARGDSTGAADEVGVTNPDVKVVWVDEGITEHIINNKYIHNNEQIQEDIDTVETDTVKTYSSLGDFSPEELSHISRSGDAEALKKYIGDTIKININGKEIPFALCCINNYVDNRNAPCGLTFIATEPVCSARINDTKLPRGSYMDCEIRDTLENMFDSMDESWKSVIRKTKFKCSDRTSEENISWVSDCLFLPAASELFDIDAGTKLRGELIRKEGNYIPYLSKVIGTSSFEDPKYCFLRTPVKAVGSKRMGSGNVWRTSSRRPRYDGSHYTYYVQYINSPLNIYPMFSI